MHYMGMAAMHMAADLRYDRLWVAASVLIAFGVAATALWIASRDSSQAKRIAAAVVMDVAVSGMHFAGMRAASFAHQRRPDRAGTGRLRGDLRDPVPLARRRHVRSSFRAPRLA
jgi:NO-binding membrane sensor protein with MHYT domain